MTYTGNNLITYLYRVINLDAIDEFFIAIFSLMQNPLPIYIVSVFEMNTHPSAFRHMYTVYTYIRHIYSLS